MDNLPRKRREKLTGRRTQYFDERTENCLKKLENENVNIPELIRIAVEEYLGKNNLIQAGTCEGA